MCTPSAKTGSAHAVSVAKQFLCKAKHVLNTTVKSAVSSITIGDFGQSGKI